MRAVPAAFFLVMDFETDFEGFDFTNKTSSSENILRKSFFRIQIQTFCHFEATWRFRKPVVLELLVISLSPNQTFEELLLAAIICKGKVKLSILTPFSELGNKEGKFFPDGPHHLNFKVRKVKNIYYKIFLPDKGHICGVYRSSHHVFATWNMPSMVLASPKQPKVKKWKKEFRNVRITIPSYPAPYSKLHRLPEACFGSVKSPRWHLAPGK